MCTLCYCQWGNARGKSDVQYDCKKAHVCKPHETLGLVTELWLGVYLVRVLAVGECGEV